MWISNVFAQFYMSAALDTWIRFAVSP